jgi:glutamyl-tRNA synthetase
MLAPDAPIRVRFAPSPTGYLHVGGARTALFNWLFARQRGGVFILRLEDTDEERNTEASRRTIFEGLRWLGLDPDEGPEQGGPCGPYSQSERDAIYRDAATALLARDGVYRCFCSKERLAGMREHQVRNRLTQRYDGTCRAIAPGASGSRAAAGEPFTLRLKVPDGTTTLHDLIRGDVVVQNEDVEDIILVRANGQVVYNLAVVIDDHLMKVTHVMRGEDHLTNTFKQILIYQAMGWTLPAFAHLPLILGPTGEGKLSKRKHPEAALEFYQKKGYPPEALVNWLALIGWSYDDKTEIMTRAEMVERFSIERVGKSGARLNIEKLDWMAGDAIRRMPLDAVIAAALPYLEEAGLVGRPPSAAEAAKVRRLVAAERERLRCFSQIVAMSAWAFRADVEYDDAARRKLVEAPGADAILARYADALPAGPFEDPAALEAHARAFAEASGFGFGKLVHAVRAALTGSTVGPPLFDCFCIVGRDAVLARVRAGAARAAAGAR